MLRKLKIDALKADLSAVEAMLASRSEADDPIGWYQFSSRKEEIELALDEAVARPQPHAELGIFFGGAPVQGSRGINADFAGKALEDLQALVSKRFSGREFGRLAQRGPVPRIDNSQMLVTNIVRGSVGFVLEESGANAQMVETPLKAAVDEIADILSRVGADDEAVFDEAATELDERILVTLKQFFQRLDENGATMRVVDGTRDFLLDRHAVARARERTQAMEIAERDEEMTGTLFLLPDSRRFDFYTPVNRGDGVLKGTVSAAVMRQIEGQPELGQAPIDPRAIPQTSWRVEIKTRELRERNRAPRQVHTLMRLVGPVLEPPR
ncbi:hypothetical protein AWB81_04752 [Caballeronia arationis]|uniref:hypothetical protein n=1 Tax=Caballeronia arationis TaxID=1777142 RepID=UPI00074B7378|nr:hypothetical protein [Caballeronia arationis]SAK89538.1 hypothetical protein AWB81_04752 [Caballeronia arationis]